MSNHIKVKTDKDIKTLLLKGGYTCHPKGNGYIKKIGKGRSRYHVLLKRYGLKIHIDKTRGWKHVPGSTYPLKGELRKLGFDDNEILKVSAV